MDLPALQSASRVIQDQLAKDASIIPDLGECLAASSGAQSSSLYSIFPDDTKVPFQKRKLVGIPESLFQYYNTTNVRSHMGLMPEIERAWISIDHKLFLWDYIDGQELSSFLDQPDVITDVALVRPKPELFIEDISWLLVICTPVSVVLIALSYTPASLGPDGPTKSDIKLYATDLSLPVENEMTSVIGTSDGRIFMRGTEDGNLYELHYQEGESWFGKRIQLINHSIGGVQSFLPRFASSQSTDQILSLVADPFRDCFYSLSANNTISIHKPNGAKSVQLVQSLSNIYKYAQEKVPGSPALVPDNFLIVSIHVIAPQESRSGLQIMAVTSNGVRLYFGPSVSYGYSYGSAYGSNARSLQLLHVRLPPTELLHPDEQIRALRPVSAYSGPQQSQQQLRYRPYTLRDLSYASYQDGLTVATQPGDTDNSDFVLSMSPDLSRIGSLGQYLHPPAPSYGQTYGSQPNNRPPLVEYATLLSIPGKTWAIAPVTRKELTAPPGTSAPSVNNELATQFGESPRQFMIFTNVGITFLVKRRAVDYVKAVFEDLHSQGNTQQLVEFRDSFGRDQTCAMLLGLASGNVFLDCLDGIPPVTVEISNLAKQAFYDFGERPIWAERMTYGQGDGQGTAIFSGRREGLAIYLARLLRPLWKSKITKPGAAGKQEGALPDQVIVTVQRNLISLHDFLDTNPHLFQSSPADNPSSRGPSPEQEAWKAERKSISELQGLLTRTIEALSFVLLLNDYHLGELIQKCDPDTQKIITSLTYEELVTSQNGMTISRTLVNVIIDQQIGQQISVDTVSEVLQHRCGSFCSTEDVMLYKAKENVRKAVETRNSTERQHLLSESLRLFTKGARIMDLEKLRETVGDYQHLQFAEGTIELPLVSAKTLDSDDEGRNYWAEGLPSNDPRAPALERRLQCYDLVLHSLEIFEAAAAASPSAEPLRSLAYELAFSSEDEVFHSTLYDWLIERGLADQLLETRPAFLEAHLRRAPITVVKYQLLWQFYVKNGQPLRAAEVLATLAESSEFSLHLQERVEYLTLAVGNAKSHPVSLEGHHESAIAFLTDLEEKLEVAQVQLQIWNALAEHINDGPEVGARISLLTQHLYTLSDLYQQFAIPFHLTEHKLLCLQVSDHRDDTVVQPLWTEIVEELQNDSEPLLSADAIGSRVVQLGQRFYPSESAFPTQHIAGLLVRFSLRHKGLIPHGWAPRVLVQCGVPHNDVWDVFHEFYESQVPPFHDQANVQALSSDIAVLLTDWLEFALRPQSAGRADLPVGRIDAAIDQYLSELNARSTETRAAYENIKRQLRRHW